MQNRRYLVQISATTEDEMLGIHLVVRCFLVFAVLLPAWPVVLQLGPVVRAEDHRPRSGRGGQSEASPEQPEQYIFSETFTVSSKGKRDGKGKHHAHRNSTRKHAKRGVSANARFKAKKNGVTVTLEPQLGVSDYGIFEDVRGRVYSFTGTPANNVTRMRIGGALLTAKNCNDVYDDPDPTPTEDVFVRKHYGYSPWTNYERGINNCWIQTGHNYFRIKLPNGKMWDSFVHGDTKLDL